jgi:hypothetical protein
MQYIHTITLPSFVRRSNKSALLKNKISLSGAKLSRLGRSRNWQLQASFEQLHIITEYIEQQQERSWLWIIDLLKNRYHNLSHNELLDIAASMKSLTISNLIATTDCTLAQARRIMDDLEIVD